MTHILDELQWRGLVNDVSDEAGLRDYLAAPGRKMYCGFDPTAESLHIGNLVPLLALARFKRAGHEPIALMGGATGLIGDPSGKDKERELMSKDKLERQVAMIADQVNGFFERAAGGPVQIVNNYDWISEMSAIELLRDVGKHYTVNWMLGKDSVKGRIDREESGISFTEFSYMIIQGYDFYHLFEAEGCQLQIGGSDQWGNITSGCELIRRKAGGSGFALTFPLITTASGKKFGKSEGGAVFLNPELTSPYAFYQFWINTEDQDVAKFLGYFTYLGQDEIAELKQSVEDEPHLRKAHKRLAAEVTALIHGQDELAKVEAATAALFGKGDLRAADPTTLKSALGSAPSMAYAAGDVPQLPQLLVDLGLSKSKGQARKDIEGNGISLNGDKVADPMYAPSTDDFLGGSILIVRKGKKNYGLVTLG
ncbi:MAG: tyrosine--tRNA ligase [Desulfovibrio sp.]|nr:MAG: tyrosine--tRNA ligase [Desulfovibrio sp.]